ncbi:hypothetical protein NAEGRDRAFT_78455 [Naegleria gruberi]|uniref:RGS domain-containing protein n=1 Tax=Naegleria gruberi TaxID=5762 RepID=D2V3W0_NAEGR|nr:uncharacterized protein NAEGRDRAFT_78455 [Naegleria gruberi]EFC48265.1 hypothetical protein NAEGRDRAFT_78455 [Naegleria gruberi]|eukprot:XP_002681009.1 hypothetical protein NAEGRDRAFT_78455 [Naegleria gruberi strain NEG-M]
MKATSSSTDLVISPSTNSTNILTTVSSSQDVATFIEMTPTSPTSIVKQSNYSTGIQKRDSLHKSVTGKSLPSSMKTPMTSSVTGFHSKTFKIYTCCGVLELNCLKLTSFAALGISIFAFLCLIIIISINFSIVNLLHTKLNHLDTSGTFDRDLMILACRVSVTNQYNRSLSLEYAKLYSEYSDRYYESLNNLVANVPPEILYWNQHGMSREDVKSRRAVKQELAMIELVKSGNYSSAISILDSSQYKELLTGYQDEVQSIFDYVESLKQENSDLDLATTTTSLIIICVSLVVVIPVLLVFVMLSIRKDNSKEKQLRLVRKYMIMDTINDVKLSEQFKEFCKQERSEDNFVLLEKINEYKKLCERSYDIQVFLYDTDILSSSASSSTSSTDDSSKKKNKKGFSEKDVVEIEKKKFEIAFEIFTDFLDVTGDRSVNISKHLADFVKQHLDFFAKGENESMPENLFETIECEMCVLMMDTHHRFKQFIETQLREKKMKIRSVHIVSIKK